MRKEYYSDKRYCRIDLDKFDNTYSGSYPSTHPIIKYRLFLNDIRERNRIQEILSEIKQYNSFEVARRIYASNKLTLEDIISDIESRIVKLQKKIEYFHSKYSI